MAVTVRIPTTMRPLSGGSSTVSVEGSTLGEVLAALEAAHPGFHERLFDEAGALRKFVNVFVADDRLRATRSIFEEKFSNCSRYFASALPPVEYGSDGCNW